MIKRLVFLLLLILLNVLVAQAQIDSTGMIGRRFALKRAEIEKVKKELITDQIKLTPEQATKFWPVYEQYTKERLTLRRQLRMLNNKGFNVTDTDQDLKDKITQRFALRQREIDLDKKTQEVLLGIINIRQLVELYRTEQEFLKKVMQILLGKIED